VTASDAPAAHSLPARCAAEAVGTALLLAIGLSIVIFDLGRSSPLATVLPSVAGRRALTGLLFGTTGMAIALSTLGRTSGAHINPVVTLAFWLEGTMTPREVGAYVASQLVGAVVGSVPLLAWGGDGRALGYGATEPGPQGIGLAFAGEVATTFVMVTCLLAFVGSRRLRRFTPGIFPILYCVMVWLEAPWSGTSTNPARSLGPDVVGLAAHSYWLYVAAPVLGSLAALASRRVAPVLRDLDVDVARVSHFALTEIHQIEARDNAGEPAADHRVDARVNLPGR
jgi:aquaporin Z